MNDEIKIYTLCSGSSGNCTYVRCGYTQFLIDAGVSMRKLSGFLAELGTSIGCIDAIFVTHEHSDHVKGLPIIEKYYRTPIHIAAKSADALPQLSGGNIFIHEIPFSVTLGDAVVTAFKTPHDSRASCGYTICCNDRRFGYATDMGVLDMDVLDSLCGCEAAIIEANYDNTMLTNSSYPQHLKSRIRSAGGHLDNTASACLCAALAITGTKRILLAHLSENNNTPETAMNTVSAYLRKKEIKLDLEVADRYKPTMLI